MSNVTWVEANDKRVFKASTIAQKTFRFFWRELAWDRRRIVPAYDLTAVKFALIAPAKKGGGNAVEFLWADDVRFDGGNLVEGTLLNTAVNLKGFRKGQRVSLEFDRVADWLLARDGKPEGGFTVRVIRAHLSAAERRAHDAAWGLAFGPPGKKLDPRRYACAKLHPLDAAAAKLIDTEGRAGTLKPNARGKDGWAQLHHYALAGAKGCVQALLRHGADPLLETPGGLRPADLSDALNWKDVSRVLYRAESRVD